MFFERKKDTQKVILDYYETTIRSPFEKTPSNGGYMKIPFQNPRGTIHPQVITPEKYQTENLYVLNNSHSLRNIDYDGELIVEHRSITNQDKRLYVVFLLKTKPGFLPQNNIDTLIQASIHGQSNPHLVLTLNDYLESNPPLVGSKDKTVWVIEKPLEVQSSFQSFKKRENLLFPPKMEFSTPYHQATGSLIEGVVNGGSGINQAEFDANADEYTDRYGPEIQKMMSETLQQASVDVSGNIGETSIGYDIGIGDSAYMECSPTGTSVDTIEMYNVPVKGEFVNDLGKLSLYRMVIYMFFMLILLVLVTMIVPTVYKQFVVNYLVKYFVKDEAKQPKFLIVIDYILAIFLFGTAIIITRYGMSQQTEDAKSDRPKSMSDYYSTSDPNAPSMSGIAGDHFTNKITKENFEEGSTKKPDADGSSSQADNTTILGFMIFIFTIFSIFIIQIFKQNNTLEYSLSMQKVPFELTILIAIFYSIFGVLWKNIGFWAILWAIFLGLLFIYFTFVSDPSKDVGTVFTEYWMPDLILTMFITLFYNASDEDA